ncbi:uncharacterized protein [Triticum aestivum]|uniref:uncharacterized protein n=1 Tax=Triticum aestivum TaxID=4565 RepID=UPI001D02B098|nr:uncharacterized protein LOC123170351 [Triticum aestivum]
MMDPRAPTPVTKSRWMWSSVAAAEQWRSNGAVERRGDSGAPTHELNLKTIGFIAGLVLCLKSLVIASWSHGRRGPLEFTQSYLELMGDIQCLFSHTRCLVFDLFAMQ